MCRTYRTYRLGAGHKAVCTKLIQESRLPTMNFRCTIEQKQAIEAKAAAFGFSSVGAYIKFIAMNADVRVTSAVQQGAVKIDKALIADLKRAYDAFIEDPTVETLMRFETARDVIIGIDPDDSRVNGVFGIITLYLTARNTDNMMIKAKNYRSVRTSVFEILGLLEML